MEKLTPSEIERLSEKIKQISSLIKSDSNPEELVEYSKLIKKNVSFFDRGYFAAYLLREMEKKAPVEKTFKKREFDGKKKERVARSEFKKNDSPAPEKAPRRERTEHAEKEETRERRAPREIPEGAKTLYVNLGKMGRIYGRDLIDLICSTSGVTRDDIYSVRVHDKYSFVTMSEENCNKAIAALQGTEVKGRTVQINISNRDSSQRRARTEAPVQEAPVQEAPAAVETAEAVVEETKVAEETPAAVEAAPQEAAVEETPACEETAAEAEEVKEEAPETPAESESVITFSVREI